MAQKKKIKPAPASSELASPREADTWTLCKQQGDKLRKCGSPNVSGLVTYEFPLENLSPEFILGNWGPGEYLVRYLSAGKSSGTKRFKLFHPEEATAETEEVEAVRPAPPVQAPYSVDPFSMAMENAARIQQMANASAATTMEGMAKIMAMANAGASRAPDPSIAMLAPLLQRLEQRLDALERRDSEDDEDDDEEDDRPNGRETSERNGGREGNPPAETFPVMTPEGLDVGAAIANFVNQAVLPKGQQIVEVGLALAQNHLDERKKVSSPPPPISVSPVDSPMLGGIVGPGG